MKLQVPVICLFAALFAALAMPVSAEMVVGNIRVIAVKGSTAQLLTAGGKKSPLKEGMFIQQGSKVLTGGDSTVSLVFENGAAVQVEPSSQFSIDEFIQDPFNSDNLDYKNIDKAPTRSVTKLSIPEGDMLFEVAKQKSGSSFEITTPVGVAGIRGTSGSAGSRGFGLVTGSATFFAAAQPPLNVTAGQSFTPATGLGAIPPALQPAIANLASTLSSFTPANTFGGAPPNLTPQQHATLMTAAAQGSTALAEAAAQLAAQDPVGAPEIAAAAAYVAPEAAPQIAASVAQAVPASATQVAQTVSQVVPQAAPEVAQAIINAVPTVDPQAVQQASQQGAQQGAGQQQQGTQGNQPLTTGDQGTTTAGQQLPGTGSGTSGNPGQSNPRPTPIPTPTPPSQ